MTECFRWMRKTGKDLASLFQYGREMSSSAGAEKGLLNEVKLGAQSGVRTRNVNHHRIRKQSSQIERLCLH